MAEVKVFADADGVVRPHHVVALDFDIVKEDWLVYEILDGGRVKIRCIVTAIWAVVDENGVQIAGPDGRKPWLIADFNTTIGQMFL